MTCLDLNLYVTNLVINSYSNWYKYMLATSIPYTDTLSSEHKKLFSIMYEELGLSFKEIKTKLSKVDDSFVLRIE